MARWMDLVGTTIGKIKLGIGGPQVKGVSGDVAARNAADAAYAAMRMSLVKVFGDDIQLNAGSAGSGADWMMTIRRPSTGMTHDLTVVMPSADPAPGQVLTVVSFTGNVVALGYVTIAAGADKTVVDVTNLAFGDSSPITMFSKPNGAQVELVKVVLDTPFDGTPTLSVGISGQTSKYLPTTAVDLTDTLANVSFEHSANLPPSGAEALIATYAASGATAGAARILVFYENPS